LHRLWILILGALWLDSSSEGGKEIAINDDGMAEVSGTKLYYEVKGKGDDLVLLHDGLLDSRIWDDQLGSFVRHFKVILYDRRGYGRSGIPKERFSDVRDL
jgi:pimeloyl-ACP methyl ester carboxylesterase